MTTFIPHYDIHPLAQLVPAASPSEAEHLRRDIRQNGLIHPVTLHEGKIPDGRHRYEACLHVGAECRFEEYEGDNPALFVVSANVSRRHLNEGQRAMVAAQLEQTAHGGDRKSDQDANLHVDPDAQAAVVTRARAAAATNTSVRSVASASKVREKGSRAVIQEAEAGSIAVSDAAAVADKPKGIQDRALAAVKQSRKRGGSKATLKKEAEKIERAQAAEVRKEAAQAAPADDSRITCCPIAQYAQHVPAGSVDAIVTDPPYVEDAIHLYGQLALFAAHALRPGGTLLTIAGHPYLPQVFALMHAAARDKLDYRWCIAYHQPQARQQVHSAKTTVKWKPILAYTRAGAPPLKYATDVVEATPWTPKDKKDHVWGQTLGGMRNLIGEWLPEGGVVCDPFCGAGSILVAAASLGYAVLGADIDPAHVETTKEALR